MQLKVQQAEKNLCGDTLRRKKTGKKSKYHMLVLAYALLSLIWVPRNPARGRFKSKRKVGGSSITGLDFCLNHHMGNQTPNEHSGRSGAFSPVPIRSPNMRNSSGSLESNMLKNANYPVVVDDKGTIIFGTCLRAFIC